MNFLKLECLLAGKNLERKEVSITFFLLAGNLRRLSSLVPIEQIFEKIKSPKSLIFNISTRIYAFASHLNIYRKKFVGCPSLLMKLFIGPHHESSITNQEFDK